MHIGLICPEATGHLNPQTTLGLELARRGHRVTVIGGEQSRIHADRRGLDYASLGKQLDDLGLARTAVTIRGEDDNPISPDAAVRQKGIDLTKQTLDCCAAAGVETLVGPYHSALGFFSGAGPTEDVVALLGAAVVVSATEPGSSDSAAEEQAPAINTRATTNVRDRLGMGPPYEGGEITG